MKKSKRRWYLDRQQRKLECIVLERQPWSLEKIEP